MQLTSEQTLNSAMTSLQTYEKTISIPVDLLTRKDSIKQLLLEPENYDKYIDNVNDELVAACKVVNGSVRADIRVCFRCQWNQECEMDQRCNQ